MYKSLYAQDWFFCKLILVMMVLCFIGMGVFVQSHTTKRDDAMLKECTRKGGEICHQYRMAPICIQKGIILIR